MNSQPNNSANGRRPIKSREARIFHRLAKNLAERGWTPNQISCSSTVFAALAAVCMVATRFVEPIWLHIVLWLATAVLIQLRLVANLLDGLVAVEGGKATPAGELFNEVPDRISDSLILIAAGYTPAGIAFLGWAAALAAMFAAYSRAIGASLDVGQIFVGPMAKPHRMAAMTIASVVIAIFSLSTALTEWRSLIWNATLVTITVLTLVTALRRLYIVAGKLGRQSG